jgi:hypothetical protein
VAVETAGEGERQVEVLRLACGEVEARVRAGDRLRVA